MKRLSILRLCSLFLLASLFILTQPAKGLTFALPADGGDVVGDVQTATLAPNQDLHEVARQFDVGYEPLTAANPGVEKAVLKQPISITVPTRFVLPPGPREGIVINLAEMRLYYYPARQNSVMTFPVGIGKQGWATPRGSAYVYAKVENPTWHVPASISESLASEGVYLPQKVLPGPLDPLGQFALRITIPGYLIHGTNMPSSIGTRASSGCIRLYPEDIETLYKNVPLRTPVRIINNPYKIGVENGQMFLEAHLPMQNAQVREIDDLSSTIESLLASLTNQTFTINWQTVARIANAHQGIPQAISINH